MRCRQISAGDGLDPRFYPARELNASSAGAHYLESAYDGHYYYNACRDPFRLAVDYLITGEPRAYNAVKKMNDFIRAKTGTTLKYPCGLQAQRSTIDTFDISNGIHRPVCRRCNDRSGNQPWLNKLWMTVGTTNFDSND